MLCGRRGSQGTQITRGDRKGFRGGWGCTHGPLKVRQMSALWRVRAGKVTFCRGHSMLAGSAATNAWLPGVFREEERSGTCSILEGTVGDAAYRESQRTLIRRYGERQLCWRNGVSFFFVLTLYPISLWIPIGLSFIHFGKLSELHFFFSKGRIHQCLDG